MCRWSRVRAPAGAFWFTLYPVVNPAPRMADVRSIRKCTLSPSYVHTMVKAPDPFRTLKLSTIGPAQYCGGGPRGNRRWCTFLKICTFLLDQKIPEYYGIFLPRDEPQSRTIYSAFASLTISGREISRAPRQRQQSDF